jgi:hypothetical protein
MSIKTTISSPLLNQQIELLKFYPEVLKKYFRPVLKRNVAALESRIRPNIPRATGFAESTFGSKVSGTGVNMVGLVGWHDESDPWYMNVVEHGAKAHAMNTFVPGISRYIGTHPGFSKRGFMAAGYSAMRPIIEAEMAQASEGVVKELALG